MNTIDLLHKTYGALTTALLPLAAVGFATSARGRRRFGERFGSWAPVGDVEWWLHGASVGEVQGLVPFITSIHSRDPHSRILLTTTSPTGLDRGAELVDEARLLPLDAPVLCRRALAKVVCERFVLSETELWPAAIGEVMRAGVPVHIINGRISDYTFRWYTYVRAFFAPILERCTSICVPDDEQRERFRALGVDAARVHVTGHTKYDALPRYPGHSVCDAAGAAAREIFRQRFFPGIPAETPLVVLGSLREGEERVWFAALKRLHEQGVPMRVVVAPRHAERFEFFWREIERLGRPAVRWSDEQSRLTKGYEILLLDTMGMLEEAYAASDLAFVGATLVDIGGHNPLEPAMYRVPVVVGPHTSVIREPVSRMRARRGIIEISSEADAYGVLYRLGAHPAELRDIGEAAYGVYTEYRGAAARVLSVIEQREREALR